MRQLDPANNKTILDIQNEGRKASETAASPKSKGKRKASHAEADSDSDGMDVDEPLDLLGSAAESIVPMPESSGIEALREKLHARMAQLRRGPKIGGDGEAWSRDELLEERRKQRAAMRERRRKETKEKIRREEEMRGKKAKDNKEQSRDKGTSTKVCSPYLTTRTRHLLCTGTTPRSGGRPFVEGGPVSRYKSQICQYCIFLRRRRL